MATALTPSGPVSGSAQDGESVTDRDTAAESFPEASYVIEEMRTVYRFASDGTGTKTFSFRVRVRDEAGVSAFGRVVVPYVATFQRVKVERVRVRKPDGRAVEADPGQFQDRSEAAPVFASVYTDARQLQVPVPSLSPGDVLTFRAVVTTHTPQVPGQFWIEDDFWDAGVVLEEIIRVEVPSDRQVDVRPGSEADFERWEEDNRSIFEWRHTHREPADQDPEPVRRRLVESLAEQPDVLVSSFRSWDEVGAWIGGQVDEVATVGPELRRRADSLVAGLDTDRERVKALYRHVAEEIRYVALLLGRGRYRPHSPADVLRNGYGDCKDKHTLLASLLRTQGIEAQPVLVHSQRRTLGSVPSPSQFDHMLTAVPLTDDTLWLDATSGVAPFDFLPWNLRNKPALVASVDGGRIARTPDEGRFPDMEVASVRGEITGTGRLTADVTLEEHGTYAMILRAAFREVPRSRWTRAAERIARSQEFPGELTGRRVSEPGTTDAPFILSLALSSPGFVEPGDGADSVDVPLPPYELSSLTETSDSDTLRLGMPLIARRTMALRVPPGAQVHMPLGVELDRPYATYRSSYRRDGDTIRASRVLDLRAARIPAGQRDDWEAFRSAVQADGGQQLTLRIPAGAEERALDEAGVDEAASLHQRAYELVEKHEMERAEPILERVVELVPDHEEAWNNLARTYMAQDRLEEAEEALRRQIEIAPYHDHAHNNLGLVLQRQERFEEAEAAFRRQIEIVPLHEHAHGNLGGLLSTRGRIEEALPHLERAMKLTPSNDRLREHYGMTLLREGQHEKAAKVLRPIQPELAKKVAAADSSARMYVVTSSGRLDELVEQAVPGLRKDGNTRVSPERVAQLLRRVTGSDDLRSRVDSLVRAEPDNAAYRNALACLLLYRGDFEEGLEHGLEAAQLEPEEPFYWLTLGRLQYLNGSRTFALSAYRRARELDGDALKNSPKDREIYRDLEGN